MKRAMARACAARGSSHTLYDGMGAVCGRAPSARRRMVDKNVDCDDSKR
jgi:hypothetical protein